MRTLLMILLLLFPGYAQAAEVHLAAAASLRELVRELASHFAEAHPGDQVRINTASSGNLSRQIAAGAPADLFLSANPQWMDYLVAEGKVAEDRPVYWAANRLVVVGRGGPLRELKDVGTFSRLAIGSPKSTPVGSYARAMLTAAGLYTDLEKNQRLVFTKDVHQALAYAEQGAVDGAIVYASDTHLLQKADVLLIPADSLQPEIRYPIAMTIDGDKNSAARELFELLTSAKGAASLEAYGFVPLLGGAE